MSLSDEELVQYLVERREDALSALYRRYGDLVFSLALTVLQDTDWASEITQDTFLNLWNQPNSWNPQKGRLKSWLLTIARYKAIDRLRKERLQPLFQSAMLEPLIDKLESTPSDELSEQDKQALQLLLTQLPPEQTQVVDLAFFQGMTHSEMAQKLGLPLGTVKTRLRLGLEKLRMLWQEEMLS